MEKFGPSPRPKLGEDPNLIPNKFLLGIRTLYLITFVQKNVKWGTNLPKITNTLIYQQNLQPDVLVKLKTILHNNIQNVLEFYSYM